MRASETFAAFGCSRACYASPMPAPPANLRPAAYENILGLPENVVGEIVNGDLVVSPRPAPARARASSSLTIGIGGPFDHGRDAPGGWVSLQTHEIYRRQGIPWMWFVDPAARTIEALSNAENGWLVVGSFGGSTEVRIPLFDAVAIDIGTLWDVGAPQP